MDTQFPVVRPRQFLAMLSEVYGSTEIALPDLTIGQALAKAATSWPDRDAVVSPEQGARLSWSELAAAARALAAGLLHHGIAPGARVGIWAMNHAEWIVVQLATARAGLILVTLNPAYREEELRYALALAECSAVIVGPAYKDSNFAGMLAEAFPAGAAKPFLAVAFGSAARDGFLAWEDLMASGAPADFNWLGEIEGAIAAGDPVNIQFTSGTTGAPKGVTLSHRNILNNAWATGRELGIDAADRLCLPVPLFHCFGMVTGVLMCLVHGAAIVLPAPGFNAAATLRAIADEKCTALYGVPTMYMALFASADFCESGVATLRTGIMAGSLCPEGLIEAAMVRMNMRNIAICYGMTEAPVSFQTASDDPPDRRIGSVGRIQPHIAAKLVDEAGCVVPRGATGEICVCGYNTMLGYWRNREATENTIDPAGWLHTGDLGVLDGEGYMRIVGRLKDMVIRGGENLYPKEIEDFLYRHPGIADIQVFGVADETFGEELCAWIIRRDGASLDEAEVRTFCRGKIAHHKIPRYISFVTAFPMTATGKVQKSVLRAQMEQQLGVSGQT